MESQILLDRIDSLENNNNQRMDKLETNIKEHQSMCQELCIARISHVEDIATKAHQRLNDHKASIKCLDAHKNKEIGFRKAFAVIQGIIITILAYVGLNLK